MVVSAQPFSGFTTDAIQFMADLAQNNDRSWFQPRKAAYERLVKDPLEGLCVALEQRFIAHDLPLHADPKRSPFRIYRDVRFSRDKSPYKTHLGASFPWVGSGGSQNEVAGAHGNGAYFNFQPGEMYAGGGMWMADKTHLDALRQAIVQDPAAVHQALEDPAFVDWFGGVMTHESFKRVPPGWPKDHPMADMFRWKDVVFGRRLSDADVCSPELPDLLVEGYATAIPVFRFLATLG